jgi:signal transduction histidine kinase
MLSVEDDGEGFAATESHSGMGLKGMAERVRALGGRFMVESRERGVHVRALLPRAGQRKMVDA